MHGGEIVKKPQITTIKKSLVIEHYKVNIKQTILKRERTQHVFKFKSTCTYKYNISARGKFI